MIRRRRGEEEVFSTSLTTKNQYLCYGLMLNNILNNYPYSKNEMDKALYEKCNVYVENQGKRRGHSIISLSFQEALEIMKEEELLEYLKWFKSQVEFAIKIVDKYDDKNINRKKKVSTILEEL